MTKKGYLAVGLISLVLFLILLTFVSFGLTKGIDTSVNNYVLGIGSSFVTPLIIGINYIMDVRVVVLLSLILLSFLFVLKRKREALFVVAVFAVGEIIKEGVKILIQRARPIGSLINESGFAFPSGHATFAALFFLTLIYLFKDNIKNKILRYSFISLSIILILLIGFGRIYLGVHWLTDVLGGFALGLFVFCTGVFLIKNYTAKGLSK